MPSYTVTVSAENAVRIKAAIEKRLEREDVEGTPETDRQMFDRWLKGHFTMLVYGHERRQAEGEIVADSNIAEVT